MGPAPLHACGQPTCPVTDRLHPALRRAERLPLMAAPSLATASLVRTYCVRCPLWSDRAVRHACGDVHLEALREAKAPAADLLAEVRHEVRRRLEEARPAGDRAALAAHGVAHAFAIIDGAGPEAEALRPVGEKLLDGLLRVFQKDPAVFLALLPPRDRPAGTSLPDEVWQRYLARVATRAAAEGGRLEGGPREAVLSVRDQRAIIGRDALPTAQPSEWVAVATGLGLPAFLAGGATSGGERPILVRLDPVLPGAVAWSAVPPWLLRLLDPRPDGEMVAELRAILARSVATEPFITEEAHEPSWPRAVVRTAFAEIAKDVRGRVRDVPGVGPTLVLDE